MHLHGLYEIAVLFENPESAPVVLWLQGGPGASSLFGLFVEHGPYLVVDGGLPRFRPVTWERRLSMLYVDNPVGSGFSYTQQDQGYARDVTDASRDLLEALQQLFTLFPEHACNDFYAAGQSYAGKFISALGIAIDADGESRAKINFKGIAIGNGFVDPVSLIDYGAVVYGIGLVDKNQAAVIRQKTAAAISLTKEARYTEALDAFAPVFQGNPSIAERYTGPVNYYNYLFPKELADQNYYESFVQTTRVRKAIHVGRVPFDEFNSTVFTKLNANFLASATPWFTALLEKYKVLLYTGQINVIVSYRLTKNIIASLNWSGASAFIHVSRQIWTTPEGNDVYGYVRQVANFSEVMVRKAGHIVPYDKLVVAYNIITRFIEDKPFA